MSTVAQAKQRVAAAKRELDAAIEELTAAASAPQAEAPPQISELDRARARAKVRDKLRRHGVVVR